MTYFSIDLRIVRSYTKKLITLEYIAFILLNIAIYFLLPLIFQLYGLSPDTAKMAREVIVFHGFYSCIVWPLSFTLPNVLRASNDARFTMIVGVGTMWFIRIACGIVLAHTFNKGMFGIWMAMVIDWFVRATIFMIRYRGDRWQIKARDKNGIQV